MEEKKFTAEDIITVLESQGGKKLSFPEWDRLKTVSNRHIVDLIHRLQDENKRLTEEIDGTVSMNEMYIKEVKKNAELQKQVDELPKPRKKILAYRVYSDSTLKKCSKEDLIEQIRILEHNWASAEESLNIQAKNCEMMLDKIGKETAEKFAERLKARLEERKKLCLNRWKRFEKEGETDLACYWNGKENEIHCVKADIYEICKEITEGDDAKTSQT